MTTPAPDRRLSNAPGTPLRNARLARKMKLWAVARAVGVSTGFLSQLEIGGVGPSLETARRLARYYGTAIEALFPAPAATPEPP